MPDPMQTPVLDRFDLPLWDHPADVRRESDRKLFAVLITLVTTAFAVGAAWTTAAAKVDQKLDRSEQLQVDLRQDRDVDSLRLEVRAVLGAVQRVQGSLDSANLRLRQLACDGKPPSCR